MTVAVLDIGKSNVKLNAATEAGVIAETLATPNPCLPGPPYRHHDLRTLESWVLDALAELGRRHRIEAFVPCGHGSGGVLVDAEGPVLPMVDYEQDPPPAIEAAYRAAAGSYRERGSAFMLGAAHLGRQLFWMQRAAPADFARARALLPLPQYWAWRLSGVAATEVSSLAAQSHLWAAPDGRFAPLVAAQGWAGLMPPLRHAWETLGTLTRAIAARTGLAPETRVLCGIHDSTANFYRYQAAGLADFVVVSTGTWIVALSDTADPERLDEARGMTCNADPWGRPLGGAVSMGGREFARVAGEPCDPGPTPPALAAALVDRGTMALPSFGPDDGLFPGRAGRGAVVGPAPAGAAERRALGILYTALLTDACLDALGGSDTVVLDGSFTADPLYAMLVAALRPDARVRVSRESAGPASGAALLASHETRTGPVAADLAPPPPLDIPGLQAYRARWKALSSEIPR